MRLDVLGGPKVPFFYSSLFGPCSMWWKYKPWRKGMWNIQRQIFTACKITHDTLLHSRWSKHNLFQHFFNLRPALAVNLDGFFLWRIKTSDQHTMHNLPASLPSTSPCQIDACSYCLYHRCLNLDIGWKVSYITGPDLADPRDPITPENGNGPEILCWGGDRTSQSLSGNMTGCLGWMIPMLFTKSLLPKMRFFCESFNEIPPSSLLNLPPNLFNPFFTFWEPTVSLKKRKHWGWKKTQSESMSYYFALKNRFLAPPWNSSWPWNCCPWPGITGEISSIHIESSWM